MGLRENCMAAWQPALLPFVLGLAAACASEDITRVEGPENAEVLPPSPAAAAAANRTDPGAGGSDPGAGGAAPGPGGGVAEERDPPSVEPQEPPEWSPRYWPVPLEMDAAGIAYVLDLDSQEILRWDIAL